MIIHYRRNVRRKDPLWGDPFGGDVLAGNVGEILGSFDRTALAQR